MPTTWGCGPPAGSTSKGKRLERLTFSGAKTLTPEPLKWTSVTDAPGHTGNAVLWSGNSSNLDATRRHAGDRSDSRIRCSRSVSGIWPRTVIDYAYTTISTDGGATYTPWRTPTPSTARRSGLEWRRTSGFVTQTFDLSAYAGQSVLSASVMSATEVSIMAAGTSTTSRSGHTVISDGSSVTPFKSATQIRATPVFGYNVRVVGLNTDKHKALVREYTSRIRSV